jgi:signal transduction histidine kinase
MNVRSAEAESSGEKGTSVAANDSSARKELEANAVEIADYQRLRLSADLHDGLGQELTGISLMLRSLEQRTAPAALHVAHELNEIIGLVNHAIQSVRKLAFNISPVRLERGRLLPALESLADWFRNSYGIDVRLRLMLRSPLRIDDSTATHLYLIAQEAINNAVKHGHARSVAVKLRTGRTLVYLSITDDGVGIADNSARGAGMGLKIMKYRTAMIGGVMQIERRLNGGTQLRCLSAANRQIIDKLPMCAVRT